MTPPGIALGFASGHREAHLTARNRMWKTEPALGESVTDALTTSGCQPCVSLPCAKLKGRKRKERSSQITLRQETRGPSDTFRTSGITALLSLVPAPNTPKCAG